MAKPLCSKGQQYFVILLRNVQNYKKVCWMRLRARGWVCERCGALWRLNSTFFSSVTDVISMFFCLLDDHWKQSATLISHHLIMWILVQVKLSNTLWWLVYWNWMTFDLHRIVVVTFTISLHTKWLSDYPELNLQKNNNRKSSNVKTSNHQLLCSDCLSLKWFHPAWLGPLTLLKRIKTQ